jgi:hypothetical protein
MVLFMTGRKTNLTCAKSLPWASFENLWLQLTVTRENSFPPTVIFNLPKKGK